MRARSMAALDLASECEELGGFDMSQYFISWGSEDVNIKGKDGSSRGELDRTTDCTIDCTNDADFKAVYDEHIEVLLRIAVQITGDDDAAEDLVHDSFIKAHEKGMVFPSMSDAKYWLLRVVHNASLNYVSRKKTEKKAYEKAYFEDTREVKSGETLLLDSEKEQMLRNALNHLKEKYRRIIILREYGGLSYSEIGRVLGISEGNVKVRIHRARAELARLLKGVLLM